MKKRVLPLLMAASMMTSTVSPIFAQEESFVDIDEQTFVQEADSGTTNYQGNGTETSPYKVSIGSITEFDAFVNDCNSKNAGTYYDVTLTADLDLSKSSKKPVIWNGFIKYFSGKFDGGNHTISNIPADMMLFYQIHNAKIGNLTLQLNGKPAFLVARTFSIKDKNTSNVTWGSNVLHDIKVDSNEVIQLVNNDRRNYSPFIGNTGPYFTMKNCYNYADINGPTYAGVFVGGYPLPIKQEEELPSDNMTTFENCINYGNITLLNAGLLFGNDNQIDAYNGGRNFTIKNVKNKGNIYGLESAQFFSAGNSGKYANQDSFYSKIENKIFNPTTDEDKKLFGGNEKGSIQKGNELLPTLAVSIVYGEDGLKHFRVDNPNPNYSYDISVSYPVNMFRKDSNGNLTSTGTDRVTLTERVDASTNFTTKDIFDVELRDMSYENKPSALDGENNPVNPEEVQGIEVKDKNNNLYYVTDQTSPAHGYWIDSDSPTKSGTYFYLNNSQKPNTTKTMWQASVAAYDANGIVKAVSKYSRPKEDTQGKPGEQPTTPPVIIGSKDDSGYIDNTPIIPLNNGNFEIVGVNLNGLTLDSVGVEGSAVSVVIENGKVIVTPKEKGTAKIKVKYKTADGKVVEKDVTVTVTDPVEPSNPGNGSGGATVKLNPVYRAYNPNNGEHLYTVDEKEYKHVASVGWDAEGVAFMAEEEKNGQALYRVYNPNSGLHHYTLDEKEKNTLVSLGWHDEKVAWYTSKKPQSAPVYRIYNPNDGNHHYTMNKQEKDVLVSYGWQDEGIAFRTAPIEK
ncbi:hypothetical protein [Allobaculum stercoricanis]|uniref:hypothetical protein n=1 Tax=Allobaculum stercoricanis TaxID=174709 RepID=UPI0003611702|nr:hypothetical protein [Allobaculum stercoricanis]